MLHLPDPAELAAERLGVERVAQLLAEGDAMALAEVVALIGATPPPAADGPRTLTNAAPPERRESPGLNTNQES